jgi:putative phosphoesterase
MTLRVLLLADIHGNFPALQAIAEALDPAAFDFVVNCGDSLVYAPFAQETIDWLRSHRVISILGNTDKKVLKLLTGKSFKKPSKPEKRIMYSTAAEALDNTARQWLLALEQTAELSLPPSASSATSVKIGIFHGSPADPDELLYADTPDKRFHELAKLTDCHVVLTGHSHSPYHKHLSGIDFINPGSAGRMFDGDPRASCATLEISAAGFAIRHYRIAYPVERVVAAIRQHGLPEVYATMFQLGRKLN